MAIIVSVPKQLVFVYRNGILIGVSTCSTGKPGHSTLHVGGLPGYPSSHGCVHLPQAFADDLYAITQIGTPVIIAGGHNDPVSVADPGPILGATAERQMASKAGEEMFSPSAPDAVTSILVSRADKKIYVLQNADIVAEGEAIIVNPSEPLGSNVFVWQGGDAKGSTWAAMGFHADATASIAPNGDVLQRIDGAPEILRDLVGEDRQLER